MQTQGVDIRTGREHLPAYYRPNGELHPEGRRQSKKSSRTPRNPFAFISEQITSKEPSKGMASAFTAEELLKFTDENFDFLVRSAKRYAKLLKRELVYVKTGNIYESVANLYNALDDIIGNNNLSVDDSDGTLKFIIWKAHDWPEQHCSWLPIYYMNFLRDEMRELSVSFVHHLLQSNNLQTITNLDEFEMCEDWASERILESDWDGESLDEAKLTLLSYQVGGTRWEALREVWDKSYHDDIAEAIRTFRPVDEQEEKLLKFYKKGLAFIGKDKPALGNFDYDPLWDEEQDYWPVTFNMIMHITYDTEDCISRTFMDFVNMQGENAYQQIPVSSLVLYPDTKKVFCYDNYPERFYQWLEPFIEYLNDEYGDTDR